MAHKKPKNLQTGFLRECSKGVERVFHFHMSENIDIMNLRQCFSPCASAQLEDHWRVGRFIALGTGTGVDQGSVIPLIAAIALVDMPEDMGFQAQLIDSIQQIPATDIASTDTTGVANPLRRAVSDQHIGVIRNQPPGTAQGLPPRSEEHT